MAVHPATPHPRLVAEIVDQATDADYDVIDNVEYVYAAIDPESYLDDVFGSPDAEASLTAYEQLVTGEWDGQL